MGRVRVFPYKQGSRAAKELAKALGGKVLKRENSNFKPRQGDRIINWGASDCPFSNAENSQGIEAASNKLTFFQQMKESGNEELIPEFWTRGLDIPDDSFPIVCRTLLRGHSGNGIVIADNRAGLVDCPLYTKYIKKQDEYRIHVGRGEVIDVQKKAKRRDVDDVDYRVRNHAGGFIYMRNGVAPDQSIIDAAITTLRVFRLDFGAVDVIWNNHYKRPYVLEINTAPGLEGTTVENYQKFFEKE